MRQIALAIITALLAGALYGLLSEKTLAAPASVSADPNIDGFETLAKIPMPYGNTLYLSGAYKDCPVDFRYGMVMNGGGNVSKWFCWRLNKEFGTIESTDQYPLTVEEFNWTAAGMKFLKKEVQL